MPNPLPGSEVPGAAALIHAKSRKGVVDPAVHKIPTFPAGLEEEGLIWGCEDAPLSLALVWRGTSRAWCYEFLS